MFKVRNIQKWKKYPQNYRLPWQHEEKSHDLSFEIQNLLKLWWKTPFWFWILPPLDWIRLIHFIVSNRFDVSLAMFLHTRAARKLDCCCSFFFGGGGSRGLLSIKLIFGINTWCTNASSYAIRGVALARLEQCFFLPCNNLFPFQLNLLSNSPK